jgi:regulator of sirC expression with transglutaminase-like and TPR domain
MNKRKLQSLINLLDDPDKFVFETVEKELLKENQNIIPALEEKWESSFDENCQERIENLIQNLQFKQTKKMVRDWIKTKDHDLLNGVLQIDRFQYPDLNHLKINQRIESIKNSIWVELNNSLTILEKTTILNHFLFNIHGFSINHQNIHSPQNCFLNQVLETKKGNQLTISILYTIIARLLDLPTQFIDFPKNPLIAIVDPDLARKVHGSIRNSDVLFYINPSNKGSITSRKEIEYHLKKYNYEPLQEYTEPKPDSYLIQSHLEVLMQAYQSVGFVEKEEKINSLLNLFK